jgi:hypothetical protein
VPTKTQPPATPVRIAAPSDAQLLARLAADHPVGAATRRLASVAPGCATLVLGSATVLAAWLLCTHPRDDVAALTVMTAVFLTGTAISWTLTWRLARGEAPLDPADDADAHPAEVPGDIPADVLADVSAVEERGAAR